MNKTFRQGIFTPTNPEKYRGNANNIVFRSSWELSMNKFLDGNPNVLSWSSEEIKIPYLKPTTGRVHNYFPDYFMEYQNVSGEVIREIIEIKPSNQCHAPVPSRGKRRKTLLYEQQQWAVNEAKWKAAQSWCAARGLVFRVLTEKSLFKLT